MNKEEQREHAILHDMAYCANYQVQHRADITCKAGVDLFNKEINNYPCVKGATRFKNPTSVCSFWVPRSREQAEKRQDGFEKLFTNIMVVLPFITEWKGTMKIDRQEVVKCPVCEGSLHLSQSAYNGHVICQCETEGCVSFKE